jgi:type IV secretion system protein VirD4
MQPTARRTGSTSSPGDDAVDQVLPWIASAIAGVTTVVWLGAALALLAGGGSVRSATLGGALGAAFRLPGRLHDPASAWPATTRAALPGAVLYWVAQGVAVVVLAATGAAGIALWRKLSDERRSVLGVHSDAGFARSSDLDRLAVKSPVRGRLTLGFAARRLLAAEPQASLAVVGPTGSGKTAGFVIPALLEWQGPVIATSVKNDLLEATIQHRLRQGRVWVYDPTQCAGHPGAGWSPVDSCESWHGAMRMAAWMSEAAQPRIDTVNDGDYWYSQARKGLAPYLHAAAVSGGRLADVIRWVDTQEVGEVDTALRRSIDRIVRPVLVQDGTGSTQWDELWAASVAMTRDEVRAQGADAPFVDQPADRWPPWAIEQIRRVTDREWRAELAQSGVPAEALAPLTAAEALWGKEPRLRGSVFATMENVLAGWADPGVVDAARGSDLDLDEWLSGDNTIYVVATAHEQSRLRPVLTTLVQHAIRRAYDTASRTGGRLTQPCLVLLDEAGNIAPLRDLPGYASTARSHGITLVSVWQDLAQLRAIYRDRAQTVLNNHRARLFGTGIADKDTLEYVSGLIGDEQRTEHNVSSDVSGGRRTVSEYRTYRRAAPVDVLRRVRTTDAVLLYGSELPVHLRLRPWFREDDLRTAAARPDLIHDERRPLARLHRRA